MNCEEVMDLMQRHVDRDLDQQETSRMMDHVGHCLECAAMLERLMQLSRGLEQLPRVVPPYSLVDAILPELGQWESGGAEPAEPAIHSRRSRRTRRSRRSGWITGLAGVVAFGVVIGLLINGPFNGHMRNSSHSEAAPSPASEQNDALTYSAANDNAQSDPAAKVTSKSGVSPNAAAKPDVSQPPRSDDQALSSSGGGDHPVLEGNGNKGLAPDPSSSPSETRSTSMSIQPVKEEALSPDGQWKAVLMDGALQLYRTSDKSKVYESVPSDGKRSGLFWSEDSSAVNFTYTDAEGKQTGMSLLVDSPNKQEVGR